MAAAADLQAWRDKLWTMRAKGVRTFTDQSGESVTYASDKEMAAVIAAIDRELAAAARPNTIVFITKGI